ncbi:hypothetical protein [Priestia megaterium]|uniref:hypothetical protein n=1 Tax=Priestia megaterium TaxID=1404 RepID=UPI000BFD2BF1|nr:hypothetical protein [Priestia megaterium]PGQ88359.1 hypothetical protein COA18_05360 [Priestia megaterium]
MELQKETNPKSKKKIIVRGLKIVGVLFLCFTFYGCGLSEGETMIKGQVLDQQGIDAKVAASEKKLKSTQEKLKNVEEQYGDQKEEVKEALALVDQRHDLIVKVGKKETELEGKEAEIKRLDEKIKDKQADVDQAAADQKAELEEKLSSLTSQVKAKESELAKIESGIQAKKDAPVQLNAGEYIIGRDVPVGRYKATNIGRGTNFFVYDDSGNGVVNTILGTDNGSGDYVFFALEGYLIKTEGQVKLIPVE